MLKVEAYAFNELCKFTQNTLIDDHLGSYTEDESFEFDESVAVNALIDLGKKYGLEVAANDVCSHSFFHLTIPCFLDKEPLPDQLKCLIEFEEMIDFPLVDCIEFLQRKTVVHVHNSRNKKLRELADLLTKKYEPLRKELWAEVRRRRKEFGEGRSAKEKKAIEMLSKNFYSKTGEVLPKSFLKEE